MQSTSDEPGLLARWRSWLDEKPDDWHRNLWDEFYALLHRREMWRRYQRLVRDAPEEAHQSVGFFHQWVMRNYLETQTIAIRRFTYTGRDAQPASLGRILVEVRDNPSVLGAVADGASEDILKLDAATAMIRTFVNTQVAHLDTDHGARFEDFSFADMDEVVDVIGEVWVRWYPSITGKGASAEPAAPLLWENAFTVSWTTREDLRARAQRGDL